MEVSRGLNVDRARPFMICHSDLVGQIAVSKHDRLRFARCTAGIHKCGLNRVQKTEADCQSEGALLHEKAAGSATSRVPL